MAKRATESLSETRSRIYLMMPSRTCFRFEASVVWPSSTSEMIFLGRALGKGGVAPAPAVRGRPTSLPFERVESKNARFCLTPFSETTKSSAFKSVMGFPRLSLTITSRLTRFEVTLRTESSSAPFWVSLFCEKTVRQREKQMRKVKENRGRGREDGEGGKGKGERKKGLSGFVD